MTYQFNKQELRALTATIAGLTQELIQAGQAGDWEDAYEEVLEGVPLLVLKRLRHALQRLNQYAKVVHRPVAYNRPPRFRKEPSPAARQWAEDNNSEWVPEVSPEEAVAYQKANGKKQA